MKERKQVYLCFRSVCLTSFSFQLDNFVVVSAILFYMIKYIIISISSKSNSALHIESLQISLF